MSKPIALGDSRSADLAQRADAPGPAGPSRSPAWKLAKLSPEQRIARGKAERAEAPRSSHGRWEPAGDRPDPISLLQEQAESRVPELVPIRYGRMLVSPGTFFRGAALIMASDLAATPRSGVTVQLCGDAPLSNFGLFASPERQLMFDINDFDETLPGPWEWDVKRLAASFEVAGRDLGFAPSDRRAIVRAGVREYRGRMREAADMRTLDAWCAHMNIDEVTGFVRAEASEKRLLKRDGKVVALDIAKARTRDCMRVFAKRTANVDGEPRIVRDPPLVMPIEDLVLSRSARQEAEKSVRRLVRSYRRTLAQEHHPIEEFRYVHMARKVVGVGSVGTRCWIFLMEGRDHKDPLFLQAKEAQASVLERFVGKSKYANHGQGIVAGPDRDRVLPGPRWLVRPCDRGLLRRLRRPERAGPRSPGHSREIRAAPRADRFCSVHAHEMPKCPRPPTKGPLMRHTLPARDVPERLATGAYILHAGLEKWKGTPELAAGVHGMAAAALTFLRAIPPQKFLRLLAAGEIATGSVLLSPVVPSKVAGAALTAFSASLLTMYWRTPPLHKPGSIWPTQAGIAVSKDVWMLGIGLGLLTDNLADDNRH